MVFDNFEDNLKNVTLISSPTKKLLENKYK